MEIYETLGDIGYKVLSILPYEEGVIGFEVYPETKTIYIIFGVYGDVLYKIFPDWATYKVIQNTYDIKWDESAYTYIKKMYKLTEMRVYTDQARTWMFEKDTRNDTYIIERRPFFNTVKREIDKLFGLGVEVTYTYGLDY